jgi:energy-coupling factor transporter ATP-binding protein EcfA2
MTTTESRAAVGELARDLAWLEDHCRQQPALAVHAGSLRLASALARNVIGPSLEGQPAAPLHIAVVGGAGAGKSTVVNFLAGAVVAESNPQAGYTRHPTAFLPADSDFTLPSSLGFLGPMLRTADEKPADLDEDVYQVRKRAATPDDPLAEFAIWDCPDMTTWASAGYAMRLLEVAALADVVVYVASDERYNDAVPTEFLHLLVRAGKAVVAVITKVREADADAMVAHFKQAILGGLPKLPDGSTPGVPVIAFPQMPPDVRSDPAGRGAKHRVALLNQVMVQVESAEAARSRTATNAAKFLAAAAEGLVEVARRDLAEYDAWRSAVHAGKLGFEDRYRREYLTGEPFRRFDRYRERLLELLELPGVAGKVMWAMRLPYRFGRDYVLGMLVRPANLNLAEQTVLSAALAGWLDGLQAEALRKAGTHPLWRSIATGFESGLASRIRDRFQQEFRAFELKETDDLEKAGQQMVDTVEKHPVLLGGLRATKTVADVAVVIAVFWYFWFPSWYHLLLIPLGVALTHQVAEWIARGAAEATRARVRRQRENLVSATISEPIEKALAEWPANNGSPFARLRQVLDNVPRLIRTLCTGTK